MATKEQFDLGATYTFITHAPAVLGVFRNVKVEAILDWRTAQQYGDPAAMHANVYGTLPENTAPNDFRRYYYLLILTTNGTRTILGLPWIDGDSVEVNEHQRAVLTLENIGVDDLPRIRNMVSANGFTLSRLELE